MKKLIVKQATILMAKKSDDPWSFVTVPYCLLKSPKDREAQLIGVNISHILRFLGVKDIGKDLKERKCVTHTYRARGGFKAKNFALVSHILYENGLPSTTIQDVTVEYDVPSVNCQGYWLRYQPNELSSSAIRQWFKESYGSRFVVCEDTTVNPIPDCLVPLLKPQQPLARTQDIPKLFPEDLPPPKQEPELPPAPPPTIGDLQAELGLMADQLQLMRDKLMRLSVEMCHVVPINNDQSVVDTDLIDQARSAVDAVNNVLSPSGSHSFAETAKILNIPNLGPRNLILALASKGVIYQDRTVKRWVPYQKFIDNGQAVVTLKSYTPPGKDAKTILSPVTTFTAKGVVALYRAFSNAGLVPKNHVLTPEYEALSNIVLTKKQKENKNDRAANKRMEVV